jgi:hypothetical protein
VLPADHLPELGADLVAALAALDVQDLPHLARPAEPPLSRAMRRAAVLDRGGGGGLWRGREGVGGSDRARSRSGWDGGRRGGRSVILASWTPRFGGIGTSSGSHLSVSVAHLLPVGCAWTRCIYSLAAAAVSIRHSAVEPQVKTVLFIILWSRGPGVWNMLRWGQQLQDWGVDMVSAGGPNRDLQVGYANVGLSSSCLGFFFLLLVGHQIIGD